MKLLKIAGGILGVIVLVVILLILYTNYKAHSVIYKDPALKKIDVSEATDPSITWHRWYETSGEAGNPITLDLRKYPQMDDVLKTLDPSSIAGVTKGPSTFYKHLYFKNIITDPYYDFLALDKDGKDRLIVFNNDMSFVKNIQIPFRPDSGIRWIGSQFGFTDATISPDFYVGNPQTGKTQLLKAPDIFRSNLKKPIMPNHPEYKPYYADVGTVALSPNQTHFLLSYCLDGYIPIEGWQCSKEGIAISDSQTMLPLLVQNVASFTATVNPIYTDLGWDKKGNVYIYQYTGSPQNPSEPELFETNFHDLAGMSDTPGISIPSASSSSGSEVTANSNSTVGAFSGSYLFGPTRFSDPQSGISFDIPEGWTFRRAWDGGQIGYIYNTSDYPPEGKSDPITIAVYSLQNGVSPDQLMNQALPGMEAFGHLATPVTESNAPIGGKPTRKLTYKVDMSYMYKNVRPTQRAAIFITDDPRAFQIYYGPLVSAYNGDGFEKILASIQFKKNNTWVPKAKSFPSH